MSNGLGGRRAAIRYLPSLGFIALTFAGCSDQDSPLETGTPAAEAAAPAFASARVIPGSYIIVFKPGVADAPGLARKLATENGGTLRFTYSHALKGFAAELPGNAVEALRHNPNVAYVEPDAAVEHFGGGTQPAPPAPWGLNRVDQRALPLDTTYTWGTTGAGVNVYIIDTGIRTTHQDFGGRAVWDYSVIKGKDSDIDCHGHGTHVAGTVGGTRYGVAKGVTLHAVKVLDCAGSGTWSGVIAGIDWVTANHRGPSVASMSLGGEKTQAVNDAVEASIRSGVIYAIAAGNSAVDACTFSPASAPSALTVGATWWTDAKASYSNTGSCVDLFAPGTFIDSDWNTSDTAAAQLSGTSMATPHVAGAAALYLETHPSASPATVAAYLLATATQGRIPDPGLGSPNLLLFTGDPATSQPLPPSGGGSCMPSKPWSKNCK